jgi:REP element-mobilizing transposase RayT
MTNHVHLLVTPGDQVGCSLLMKHLAQRHSKRINAKQDRTGSLWEGRFHSGLVANDEYAIACYRYGAESRARLHGGSCFEISMVQLRGEFAAAIG